MSFVLLAPVTSAVSAGKAKHLRTQPCCGTSVPQKKWPSEAIDVAAS